MLSHTPIVLIADPLAPEAEQALGDAVEIRRVAGTRRPDLLQAVRDADALIVRSATTVDREVIDAAERLRVIGRAGVGIDNIDVDAAAARGITVANTPTANIHSACEHAIALLLAAARETAWVQRWAEAGFPLNVRELPREEFAELAARADAVAVRDAGFTEVAPGSTTALAIA